MRSNRSTLAKITALLFCAAFLTGCASFPGNKIPPAGAFPDKSTFSNKPSVYFETRFETHLSGMQQAPAENILAREKLTALVEEAARQSGLFSSYTTDRFEATGKDYTIQINVVNYGDALAASLGGAITGLTLFLVPCRATDGYKVNATVLDSNGQELCRYEFDDCVRTWFHLFMIFAAQNTPEKAVDKVLTNMIKTLLLRIAEQDLLKYSWLTPNDGPRVEIITLAYVKEQIRES